MRRPPLVSLCLLVACNGGPSSTVTPPTPSPPSSPDVVLSPDAPDTTDTLHVDLVGSSVSDIEAGDLSLILRWSRNGTEVPTLAGQLDVDPAFTAKGELWTVSVQASDGTREGEPNTASVTVVNARPTVAVAFERAVTGTDQDLVAVVTAEDPDGDALTLSYVWSVDGATSPIVGDTVPASLTERGQRWTVTVSATDGEAEASVSEAFVDILNSAPSVLDVALSPDPVRTLDPALVTYNAEDLDGDAVTVRFEWEINGAPSTSTGQTLPSTEFQRGDTVRVGVTASDGFIDSATVWASVVVDNTAPSITAVALSSTVIDASSELRCLATGWFDADGDPEGIHTVWYVNDATINADTLSSADFAHGDTVACQAIPFDGALEGVGLISSSAVVLNSLPVLDSVTIGPPDPLRHNQVSASLGTVVDLDGDSITYAYEWLVNGAAVGTAPTLSGSSFRHNDTIALRVWPLDGTDMGAAVQSNELVGGNNLPEVLSVTLPTGDLYTHDVIESAVATNDADGEAIALAYAWYANGSLITGASDASLDGALYFDKGQEITLVVTPDDGSDAGAAVSSAAVTISNTLPTAPALALSPQEPASTDAVQCTVAVEAYDEDDDAVDYTFTWYDGALATSNGTSTTYSRDTLPATDRYPGDSWTCEVVPNDGEADGDAVEITVGNRGPWRFASCGARRNTGPSSSDCAAAYASTTLDGKVTVTEGLQAFSVPATGTYRIEVQGAQGASVDPQWRGGLGARVRGDFALTRGDILTIIVGQEGWDDGCSGGGGGGSFVLDSAGDPLIIAGGGGGVRSVVDQSGCPGRATEFAGTGSGTSTTWSCEAKTTGLGMGGIRSASGWGSAGAGLYSDGANDQGSTSGGRSPSNGALGGGSPSDSAYGGFGGGGSGNGNCGAGGGGGYSGGDGGRLGGGGGSYNSGADPLNEQGYRTGNGSVVIERL